MVESNNNLPIKIVVIVDDDEDLLKILTFSFKSEGFDVVGFVDGTSALQFLTDEKNLSSVSLLILDRLLPDMDGIKILKQLSEKHTKHIPVLILSTLSAEKDILTGLKFGAVDYVTKPFNLHILLEKSLRLINQA